MSAVTTQSSLTRTPLFERILCVAGPSAPAAEAVRQAALLAGPDTTVDLAEPAAVLENVEGHDLIVVPGDGTDLDVLTGASTSVLVARAPSSSGGAFPDPILVAVDETAEAYAA